MTRCRFTAAPSDFTYYDTYTLNSDGSSDDSAFSQHYLSSTDGTIRIGYGIGPYLSLNVAIQAPALSGSGVFLNPAGRGERRQLRALYRADLSGRISYACMARVSPPPPPPPACLFPNTFNGVQVFINQTASADLLCEPDADLGRRSLRHPFRLGCRRFMWSITAQIPILSLPSRE